MDSTTRDQYLEETLAQNGYNEEDKPLLKCRSFSDAFMDSNDSLSGGFECNICLDRVQEPMVTLCGHLYCWPCIYICLHFQNISAGTQDQQPQQQCPVCKAEVSQGTLVPLFGRGQTDTTKSSQSKFSNLGIIIPPRPLACRFDSPRSPPVTRSPRPAQHVHNRNAHQSQIYYPQPTPYPASASFTPGGTTTNMFDPVIGMVGELIYTRVFGNSTSNMFAYPNSYHLAATASPRVRRQVMQADRSLSRICLFLFCCAFLCLLLF